MTFTLFGHRITLFSLRDVTQEMKDQVVNNIETTNSYEYRHQVAEHHLVNAVLDDILADPYWYEIAVQALPNLKGN